MRDDIAVSYAKSLNRSRCRLGCGWVGPTKYASCRVHTGATWRILLNRPRAAAMRPFCEITLTTCCYRLLGKIFVTD